MPTAVERGFNFLKLDGIDGRHEQAAINDAFQTIGLDLLKLSTAPTADAFLKLEHDPGLKGDLHVVGDYFLKLGADFTEIADIALKIDAAALKLRHGGQQTAAAVDGSNLQADFHFADGSVRTTGQDLKLLGGDFLKLDRATDPSFDHKLGEMGADFLKLSVDTANNAKAFAQLGSDFQLLGQAGALLPAVYKELGGDLRTVADGFGALSNDFHNIGTLLTSAGGGRGFNADTAAQFASDLKGLNQDFLKLDQGLGALAGPSAEAIHGLIGLL